MLEKHGTLHDLVDWLSGSQHFPDSTADTNDMDSCISIDPNRCTTPQRHHLAICTLVLSIRAQLYPFIKRVDDVLRGEGSPFCFRFDCLTRHATWRDVSLALQRVDRLGVDDDVEDHLWS